MMDAGSGTKRGAAAFALALLLALSAVPAGCSRNRQKAADGAAGQAGSPQQGAAAAAETDISKLDTEIERLERLAERNPADEETRDELARAYVRRAQAEHGGGRHREALADYQRALRHDPDNGDAQSGAAAATEALGGVQEGEYGEPAPLPITPNVAEEGAKPTPKKQ